MSENRPADKRKARLAQALRENLKRRKAQIRARETMEIAPEEPDMPTPESLTDASTTRKPQG